MANWFSFAGVTSTAKGVYVQDFPPATLPEERAEFVDIPGRSGSLTVLEGDAVYDDIILTINCYVRDLSQLDAISAWLRGSGELVLGNMPDRYYVARCVNQIEIAKLLRASGHRTFAAVFRCRPYRYIYPPVAAYALDATIKTIAKQAAGTPTLTSPLALTGYDKITLRLPKNRNLMPPLTEVKSSYGVTFTPNGSTGSILVTGTSTKAISFALVGAWNSGTPLYSLAPGTYTLKQSSPDIDVRLISKTTTLARASAPTFTLVADTPVTSVFAVIAAGKTLNTTINFQVEEGTASTAYIKYDAVIKEITPLSAMWGISGYEDRWRTNGGEQPYTNYTVLNGSESGWYESTGNAGANTKMYALPLLATTPQASARYLYPGVVSNRMVDRGIDAFFGGAYADTGSVCALHAPSSSAYFNLYIRVPTSLAANLAAFKAWMASNTIQVVYRKEASGVVVFGAPLDFYSATGTDRVLSDGAVTEYAFNAVESILLTAPADIVNTGTAEAVPQIAVAGSGDIDLTIGGRTIHIDGLASAITIDCETGMAYNGATDLTSTVTMDYYPWTIQPGTSAVAWTGSVTSVTITPAWRYI